MRRLLGILALLALPTAARAASCVLQISMTCTPSSGGSTCRATTLNAGTDVCAGEFITGYIVPLPSSQVTVTGFTNSLGIGGDGCFDSSQIPGDSGSTFAICFGEASLAPGATFTASADFRSRTSSTAPIPVIGLSGVLDDNGDEQALVYVFSDALVPTCTPEIGAPAVTQSGVTYTVSWSAVSNPQTTFQIDESTSADFTTGVTTKTVQGLSTTYSHTTTTGATFYYRVRATNCDGGPGPYSRTASTAIAPPPRSDGRNVDAVVPFGSTARVSFPFHIPNNASGKVGTLDTSFSVSTDQPFLSVSPASGTLPPGGTDVTVTVDPTSLPPGANTGTVTATGSGGSKLTSTSASVSLVTPVTPGGKSTPPANALIIPVVTHVIGATGPFQSDVRLTNAGAAALAFQITFTPTRTNGTTTGKTTPVTVPPGQTIALNDIVKDFFGFGVADPTEVGFGALEIRPLNTSSTAMFASSRTFATTSIGTFGQFIAAIPFSQFGTNIVSSVPLPGPTPLPHTPHLSLQQIAESAKFRTNLGLVEGSGTPASGHIRVFDDAGSMIGETAYSLLPGEHQQINRFLNTIGIASLEDGRIEVTVESLTGAVTAYASVLDNITTDPLAVQPVDPFNVKSDRYVLPGMAELVGASNFHSDVRIYNGGVLPASVTLSFYPFVGVGSPKTLTPITIGPGQVKVLDNILPTLFGVSGTGGSVVATTSGNSSLVLTGRTYTLGADGGTFGQFIPGVMPSDGVGLGDRPLQLLQMEQSSNFRSNLGLAELTGNPATVRITLTTPDSKVSSALDVPLGPYEFKQFGGVINSFLGAGLNTYNARMSVQVIAGTGRVTSHASVIDNFSTDPTYVPAQ